MRAWWLILLMASTMVQAQSSSPAQSQTPDTSPSIPARKPSLAPPRSDRVDANDLPEEPGESSSKDNPVDLSAPPDDAKTHPHASDVLTDEGSSGNADVGEFHPWDPHKAAKDVEVGDFYFKKKNYIAAESRYREALFYKDNDAVATYRLAVCLEKMDRGDEARAEYETYLKILPYGPESSEAKKALERLKTSAIRTKNSK